MTEKLHLTMTDLSEPLPVLSDEPETARAHLLIDENLLGPSGLPVKSVSEANASQEGEPKACEASVSHEGEHAAEPA